MHTTHGAVNMSNHTVAVGKDEKISQSTFKKSESERVGIWGSEKLEKKGRYIDIFGFLRCSPKANQEGRTEKGKRTTIFNFFSTANQFLLPMRVKPKVQVW